MSWNHTHPFCTSFRHNQVASNYQRRNELFYHFGYPTPSISNRNTELWNSQPNQTRKWANCVIRNLEFSFTMVSLLQIPVIVQSNRQIAAFFCNQYHHSSMFRSSSRCNNSPVHNPLVSTKWVRTTALSLLRSLLSVFTQFNLFLKQTRHLHNIPKTLFLLPNQNSPFFQLLSFRNVLFSC